MDPTIQWDRKETELRTQLVTLDSPAVGQWSDSRHFLSLGQMRDSSTFSKSASRKEGPRPVVLGIKWGGGSRAVMYCSRGRVGKKGGNWSRNQGDPGGLQQPVCDRGTSINTSAVYATLGRLDSYPQKAEAEYLALGFQEGFTLYFPYEGLWVHSISKNLRSILRLEGVVRQTIRRRRGLNFSSL